MRKDKNRIKIKFLTRLQGIFLYQDTFFQTIDYQWLKEYLEKTLQQQNLVEIRQDPFSFHLLTLSPKIRAKKIEQIAEELARIRIRNPEQISFPDNPLPLEVDYEVRNLNMRLEGRQCKSGAIYDAYFFMKILGELLPEKEKKLSFLHIVITEQMIASYEPQDQYHLRSSFYGYPTIISSAGLIEAPARPREFYLQISAGVPKEIALASLKGQVLQYNDPRLTEVLKAELLKAVFYQLIGFPHCEQKSCLLFNAHWQEELVQAQLHGKLCPVHKKILQEYLKI